MEPAAVATEKVATASGMAVVATAMAAVAIAADAVATSAQAATERARRTKSIPTEQKSSKCMTERHGNKRCRPIKQARDRFTRRHKEQEHPVASSDGDDEYTDGHAINQAADNNNKIIIISNNNCN